MKRVWVQQIPCEGESVDLSMNEHHHLTKVRRVDLKSQLEVLDGRGGLATASILESSRKGTRLKILKHLLADRESPLTLHLGLALPHQKSTLEDMLPGLVQLGVSHLHLLETKFSGRLKGPPEKALERMSQIALQALKQCGRLYLPKIERSGSLAAIATDLAGRCDRAMVLHPNPEPPNLKHRKGVSRLALLVGPEGGFADDEVAEILDAGFETVGLGPRILKMETAAVGACFWAQTQYGDMSALKA